MRTLDERGAMFITQRPSHKVAHLLRDPRANLTFWFPQTRRHVVFEGEATLISDEERLACWEESDRFRQLRFSSYAPTSGQPIPSLDLLHKKLEALTAQFPDIVPLPDDYIGFRVDPHTLLFYDLEEVEFSRSTRLTRAGDSWEKQLLSP